MVNGQATERYVAVEAPRLSVLDEQVFTRREASLDLVNIRVLRHGPRRVSAVRADLLGYYPVELDPIIATVVCCMYLLIRSTTADMCALSQRSQGWYSGR